MKRKKAKTEPVPEIVETVAPVVEADCNISRSYSVTIPRYSTGSDAWSTAYNPPKTVLSASSREEGWVLADQLFDAWRLLTEKLKSEDCP